MRDPKRALLFLQGLHTELSDSILDSGVVFLLDKGNTDWYIFIKAEGLTQRDTALIETLLMGTGERSEYSINELSTHPKKAFMSSGLLGDVLDSLDALGEAQFQFRAKAQLN